MARHPKPWFRSQTGWWMVQLDGKQEKLAQGKNNRNEANAKLYELMLQRAKNPPPESDEHTVASIIDKYLEFATGDLASGTLYLRKRYLQLFAESEGWRPIRDCLPIHLSAWLERNRGTWTSDWTRSSVIAIVNRPFNWAVQQRLIGNNPFRGVHHRRGEPRPPITDEQFQDLLRATAGRRTRTRPSPGARFREVLIFLRFTGCRPGEAAGLEWEHVDLERGMITLREHKTRRTQRIPKPRVVPLDPIVLKLLIHVRRRKDPGNRVFLTHRLTPWSRHSLSRRVRRARFKAGIPDVIKLYGVRHGFGTRAIVNGVDIKTLAQLLGHSSTRMTEHYVHLAGQQQHLADAMRQANGRRRGS